MMNNPFVSVIIPNYNHARFLDERIHSVLNQTYQQFEMIILDDKSSDNSLEVITKYKDYPQISHIVANEENGGSTFKQWQKGLELAKGDLVWIAESDDSCSNTMLETLVKGCVNNDAVLAFCRSCKYDVQGNKSIYAHQSVLLHDIVMQGTEFISKYMIEINVVANASSAIFNRTAAMSVDKQYMTMRGEGDWLFWIELMETGKVFFCSDALNYFRFHGSNTTNIQVIKGISAIEHKTTFDYLVQHGYLEGIPQKIEKLRLLNCWLGMNFENKKIKRDVLNVWDRNRLGRLYLLCSHIKEGFKLIASLV